MMRRTLEMIMMTLLLISIAAFVGFALISCTEVDGDIDKASIPNSYVSQDNQEKMTGYYCGRWTLNDYSVFATLSNGAYDLDAVKLEMEKFKDIASVSLFNTTYDNDLRVMFEVFPYEDVANVLFPGITIKQITDALPDGTMFTEKERLLFSVGIDDDGKENLSTYISGLGARLKFVGYSDDTAYFEFAQIYNYQFIRYPYVVTTGDGNYFAIVLDVMPSLSYVVSNFSMQALNLQLSIPQVEIYDRDGNKTVRAMTPGMIIKFVSNKKISKNRE